MMSIALGSQASGSTWLFNVMLALNDASGAETFSCCADDGSDALDRMPLDVNNVILKSHAMDQRLVRIARLSGAKIVLSTRDPLDSVVSQHERFGLTVHDAAVELSRSFSTIRSIPKDLPQLCLRYEDRFTEKVETVNLIANFLNINISNDLAMRIFADLTPDAVRARIASRIEALPTGVQPTHDPLTHWHAGHVGDGRTGKWRERLTSRNQEIVRACLSPLASSAPLQNRALKWPSELFIYKETPELFQPVGLMFRGGPEILSWGPYLHLPRGRWLATPDLRLENTIGIEIEVDVYLPWSNNRINQKTISNLAILEQDTALYFNHYDYFEPIELRIWNIGQSSSTLLFFGWRLEYIGDLE